MNVTTAVAGLIENLTAARTIAVELGDDALDAYQPVAFVRGDVHELVASMRSDNWRHSHARAAEHGLANALRGLEQSHFWPIADERAGYSRAAIRNLDSALRSLQLIAT